MAEIRRLKLSQFYLITEECAKAQREQMATLLWAVNMGSHAKPSVLKAAIKNLTADPKVQKVEVPLERILRGRSDK